MRPTDSNFHQGFCSTKKWNERYVLVAPPAIETMPLILSSLNGLHILKLESVGRIMYRRDWLIRAYSY